MQSFLKIILMMLGLTGSASALAVAHLDTSGLSESDLASYAQCRRVDFLKDSCDSVLRNVCKLPANKSDWDCVAADFSQCSKVDYATPECESLLTRVCHATGDQYSDACDRFHYEMCKRQDFSEKECQPIRITFSLPRLTDAIEAEAKETASRNEELIALIRQASCGKARSDKTNPLYETCLPETDNGPIDLDTFEDLYETAQYKRSLTPELKTHLYRRFLASPPSGNTFDQAEMVGLWLREDEAAAGSSDPSAAQTRRLALRTLAERGDDSIMVTFLLLQEAQDDDSEIRLTALRGLGTRSYQSGLSVLALIQALRSDLAEERIAGLVGLASRWQRDLQSSYFGRLDYKQLGSLLDCRNVSADLALYDRVQTMADVQTINLNDPRSLCSIGRGANLFRLKREIWSVYTTTATNANASDEERSAALIGMAKIAVGDRSTQTEARRLAASLWTSAPSQDLRHWALALLAATTDQSDGSSAKALFTSISKELTDWFSQQPTAAAPGPCTRAAAWPDLRPADESSCLSLELGGLLKVAQSSGFIGGTGEDGSLNVYSVLPLLRDQCIQRTDLPTDLRTICFKAATSALDPTIEDAYWPTFLQLINSHGYGDRESALNLLDHGDISFIDASHHTTNCERREEVADIVGGMTVQMLRSHLGASLPQFTHVWKTLRGVTVESSEVRSCSKLVDIFSATLGRLKDPAIMAWLNATMAANMPRLPVKSWYDEYTPTNRTDVVERVDISPSRGDPTHAYRVGHNLVLKIREIFEARSVEDMLVRAYAWYGIKDAYQTLKSQPGTKDADLNLEFWGISAPRPPHKD